MEAHRQLQRQKFGGILVYLVRFLLPAIIALSSVAFGSGCRRKANVHYPIFDVPSLLGKNIHEIESALGPSPKAPPTSGDNVNIEHKLWTKDGETLDVAYSKSSGLVSELTLNVDAAAGSLKDADKPNFLRSGNLKESDAGYTLAFVEAPDKVFQFTGAKVTPPASHTVQLHVTGASALMVVTYSHTQSGATAAPEQTLTMPPWDTSLTANIGDTVEISAMLYGQGGSLPDTPQKIGVQILVDGKVLCEKSQEGWSAKCSLQL